MRKLVVINGIVSRCCSVVNRHLSVFFPACAGKRAKRMIGWTQDSWAERCFSNKKGDDQSSTAGSSSDVALQQLLKEMEISLQETDSFSVKLTKEFLRKKKSSEKPREFRRIDSAGMLCEYKMKKAVDDVAESVASDSSKVKSELMDRLEITFSAEDIEFENLAETELSNTSKMQSPFSQRLSVLEVNLNAGGERLNVFGKNIAKEQQPCSSMCVWAELEQLNLKRMNQHPPRNGFEEMIQWTQEGKLYPYPVDNGYLWFENNYHFHEHVFLEPYVENKIPNEGPIRRFMDLVIHGLSTNPYMSVQKKREHLDCYTGLFKQMLPSEGDGGCGSYGYMHACGNLAHRYGERSKIFDNMNKLISKSQYIVAWDRIADKMFHVLFLALHVHSHSIILQALPLDPAGK
uniref:Small ribosomal subunit protein mS31 n=1 Tax=Trichuris muris TaxID=70415 RepID=A0A5S6QFY5_TRIMR